VVLGLSGGIDSSITLALLIAAAKQQNSPIKKIVGMSMPIHSIGASDQHKATQLATLLSKQYESLDVFSYDVCDLTDVCDSYVTTYNKHQHTFNIKQLAVTNEPYFSSTFIHNTIEKQYNDAFAIGQLLSVVRTPYLYFNAAVLQTKGYKSIVAGTINRDEGGYIGFFGKASDAMVDLQVIADLHKSEVYQLAHYFDIPQDIINESPKGDVYDGRNDFEMIGATYDQIELFTFMKNHNFKDCDFKNAEWYTNIESLHKTNEHKYRVGIPSRFVDVMPRKVIGGWQ
jgi:NAD+ synthase (glutamine-hydrolysing)